MSYGSYLNPYSYTKKNNNAVTTPSPLQTSFSLFSPVSPLQPKFENFDFKDENYNEILQYNVLNFFKKKVKKDELVLFNSYPYKVSEDLRKIFNNQNIFKNRSKLSINNPSIMKEVIEKVNLLSEVSKCIVEPDWDIFQNAASIIQAHWRGYMKRKEFINKYLENASQMKNIKFVKNYNYFSKNEPKYLTKAELYSKIELLSKHKSAINKSQAETASPISPLIKAFKPKTTTEVENSQTSNASDRIVQAAIKIQSDYRGHIVRSYYKKYQNGNIQATKIQALWRGYITRKKYELNVTMNSLKKLCQQHTFLIENIYKLINPFITPDNKLTFSLYEEKIGSLTHKLSKLTLENSKKFSDNEKNINHIVKDRQKDKDEYLKQINSLKR